MNKFENKIEALLKSQTKENNTLAFQLIQSQWNWSIEKTLIYIFDFQVISFWNDQTTHYTFEVDKYKFNIYFQEEDDIYVYGLDLICIIQTPTKKVYEKKYLGSFDYDFGFGTNAPSSFLDHLNQTQKLVHLAITKIIDK